MFRARDAQLPPRDLGWYWLFRGGRGTGKSHSIAETSLMRIRFVSHQPCWRARSAACRTTSVAMSPPKLTSSEEPESLRGPQRELCVIDEIGRMRYQQRVFDNMMLGLRLGTGRAC